MFGLRPIRLVAQHGFEWSDGLMILALAIINQSNVETYSGDLRRELFSSLKLFERAAPLLLLHVDDAQVHARPQVLGLQLCNFEEVLLGLLQLTALQSGLTGLEVTTDDRVGI